ncbi:MAG: alkaline phosphatase [Planctomycetia bacterium]|nr:alkaline phosphatase [Planctomycetia bacterium]
MKRTLLARTFSVCLTLFCLTAFVQGQEINSPLPGIEHVVLIGSDGFGSHYIDWEALPNLKDMKEHGAWTVKMRSVLPSSSALNWTSILKGAPSEMHGFRTWGSKEPDIPPIALAENGKFPCLFRVLREQMPNAVTTAVYSWDGIEFVFDAAAATEQKYEDGDSYAKKDAQVLATALEQLAKKPTFAFIYFGEPDGTGHNIGWGTPEYQAMLTTIDGYVGQIMTYLKDAGMMDKTIVLFISDHGGSGKGHGEGLLEHMEVPWMIYGPGVKVGEITDAVVNYDNAATIAWLLGLKQPQAWRGQVIKSAFTLPDCSQVGNQQ